MSTLFKSIIKSKKGFTLLEVLLVVGIITILAAIVIVAINPSKQFGDAKNAQRRGDVNTILNAVYQYSIDFGGNLPDSSEASPAADTLIPTGVGNAKEICKSGVGITNAICSAENSGAGFVDISDVTNSGTYLVSLPIDPATTSGNGTGYKIYKDANNRLTVLADQANPDISATR